MSDTIVALATPPGVGAIAVVRISGNDALKICGSILFNRSGTRPARLQHARAVLSLVRSGDEVIDEALITCFRSPASFTGEDVVEIYCHGSSYIQQRLVNLILDHGARLAARGEFTFRAFMNGKMDLSQAEAVGDLVNAESGPAQRLALSQMRGGFSHTIGELRRKLLEFASLLELELDFSEEDVEFADRSRLRAIVNDVLKMVKLLEESFRLGNALKNGVPVAIAGRPNAGKSTLLNALLREERAIVSNIAGTTRDTIEDKVMIGGVQVRLIDTAGLRESADEIEKAGIARTYRALENAEVVLLLFDASEARADEVLKDIGSIGSRTQGKVIPVANKSELRRSESFDAIEGVIHISAKQGKNLDALGEAIVNAVAAAAPVSQEVPVTNARHASALRRAGKSLADLLAGLDSGVTGELLSADLRHALDALGEITGEVRTDDILSSIFSTFCIGK